MQYFVCKKLLLNMRILKMMSVTLLFWIPPREFIKLISFNDFAAYLKENKLLKKYF